jgi:hypothetical protein
VCVEPWVKMGRTTCNACSENWVGLQGFDVYVGHGGIVEQENGDVIFPVPHGFSDVSMVSFDMTLIGPDTPDDYYNAMFPTSAHESVRHALRRICTWWMPMMLEIMDFQNLNMKKFRPDDLFLTLVNSCGRMVISCEARLDQFQVQLVPSLEHFVTFDIQVTCAQGHCATSGAQLIKGVLGYVCLREVLEYIRTNVFPIQDGISFKLRLAIGGPLTDIDETETMLALFSRCEFVEIETVSA